MTDLLSLLRGKVESSKIRRASGRQGGEYHSPCPLCGGDDRFVVFPEQDGGELCRKHGLRGTWSCPRGCGKGGDLIAWFTLVEGLKFSEACAELGIKLEGKQARRRYRPLSAPRVASPVFTPASYAQPCETWRSHATKLANEAHARLLSTPAMMGWLAARGLPEAAARAYRLGYIAEEGTQKDCIFRARSAFGLPEKTAANGRPVRVIRIPRGITIPVWSEAGEVLRVRIRRRDADRERNNPKDPKYLLLPQPGQPYSAPLMLPPVGVSPDLATWVVVEAELDAMAVHHACGGEIGAISILTVRARPDAAAHAALSRAARILVALDADEDKADGSNPGADAWPWWQATYPQARLWPVPEGKDPGEAFARGVDLAAWVFAGIPLRKKEELSLPGLRGMVLETFPAVEVGGEKGISEKEVAVVEERETARECWPVPGVARFDDIRLPAPAKLSRETLLEAMRKAPLDDPDCLVPCPRTKPAFWWRYYRECKNCKGHQLCLLGLIQSEIFMEAAYGNKN